VGGLANNEYVVAGPDWTDPIIKARRIGLDAQPIGAAFDVPSLNLASNGSEYYVVWTSNFVNLVGSRMTADGTLLTPGGVMLVSNYSQYNQCAVAHDGVNWWMEWGAAATLRTLRINPQGVALDPDGGVLLPIIIGGSVNNAYGPMMVARPGGGVHVLWYDLRIALGNDANVFVLPMTVENTPGVERLVSTSSRNQRSADMAEGPAGAMAMVYISELANDDAVMVRLLNAAGQPTGAEPIEVAAGPTISRCGIAWNGSLYMIVWDLGAAGLSATQIKARRMSPDGSFIDAAPIDVMSGFNPDVGALGDDFLVAAPRYQSNPQFIDLWGRRYDGPSGAALDASSILLASGYVSGVPRVRSDGTRWLVGAHAMWTHDSPNGDAILCRVPAVGQPLPAINPTPIVGGTGDLDIAFSGSNSLLVWRMNTLSNANNYIAGRIMNVGDTFGPYFIIAEAPGRQLRPTAVWDGTNYIVAWDDQRNQAAFFDARTDIYGTRVSQSGVVLHPSGFAITAGPQGDAGVALLAKPTGTTFAASARFTLTPTIDSYRIGMSRIGPATLLGDVDGDGAVDVDDLLAVILAWGPCPAPPAACAADVNQDGAVDVDDMIIVIVNWT
jgi:hypothetical protein